MRRVVPRVDYSRQRQQQELRVTDQRHALGGRAPCSKLEVGASAVARSGELGEIQGHVGIRGIHGAIVVG